LKEYNYSRKLINKLKFNQSELMIKVRQFDPKKENIKAMGSQIMNFDMDIGINSDEEEEHDPNGSFNYPKYSNHLNHNKFTTNNQNSKLLNKQSIDRAIPDYSIEEVIEG